MTICLSLAKVRVPNSNLDTMCDISTGKIRPFVPEWFRRIFFSSFHNLSHPGSNTSVKLLTDIFSLIWSRIFDCGQEPVNNIKRVKFCLQMNDLNMYILLVLYLLVRDIHISWLASIVFLVGAKSFQLLILTPILQRKHSWPAGCPVSVFQLSLLRIGVNSSNQVYSANWWNFCRANESARPPITLNLMAW